MDFSAFEQDKLNRYTEEAKARWGDTAAWKEYDQKSKGRSKSDFKTITDGLMDVFRELGKIRALSPESPEAQTLIHTLRCYITEHFYTCTPEILSGLGQMYAAEGEMKNNIDAAGGEGTAEFASRAIEVYTSRQ